MNTCVWFEIYIDDVERACTFYEFLLGAKIAPLANPTDNGEQMFAIPSDGTYNDYGSTGALVKSNHKRPGQGGTLVYFGCLDCEQMLSRAIAAGGKAVQEKVSLGDSGAFTLAEDTEGNVIGFHAS